jgi:hypothetical protein
VKKVYIGRFLFAGLLSLTVLYASDSCSKKNPLYLWEKGDSDCSITRQEKKIDCTKADTYCFYDRDKITTKEKSPNIKPKVYDEKRICLVPDRDSITVYNSRLLCWSIAYIVPKKLKKVLSNSSINGTKNEIAYIPSDLKLYYDRLFTFSNLDKREYLVRDKHESKTLIKKQPLQKLSNGLAQLSFNPKTMKLERNQIYKLYLDHKVITIQFLTLEEEEKLEKLLKGSEKTSFNEQEKKLIDYLLSRTDEFKNFHIDLYDILK